MTQLTPYVRIVDDDQSVRNSLTFLLTNEGYRTQAFSCAADFLREDRPSVPGVVILDVRMPQMSGLELFDKLKERSYRNPVIFLTAHGDIEMAVFAMQMGAFNFLEKPVVPEKLLGLIAKAMEEAGIYRTDAAQTRSKSLELLQKLTPRERQILMLVNQGLSNREVGERLSLSERTVENHRAAGYRKLGVTNSRQLEELLSRIVS